MQQPLPLESRKGKQTKFKTAKVAGSQDKNKRAKSQGNNTKKVPDSSKNRSTPVITRSKFRTEIGNLNSQDSPSVFPRACDLPDSIRNVSVPFNLGEVSNVNLIRDSIAEDAAQPSTSDGREVCEQDGVEIRVHASEDEFSDCESDSDEEQGLGSDDQPDDADTGAPSYSQHQEVVDRQQAELESFTAAMKDNPLIQNYFIDIVDQRIQSQGYVKPAGNELATPVNTNGNATIK